MKLTVNQQSIETKATNLEQLVAELNLPNQGVAVAVNNRLVKRTEWADFSLTDDAQITIIKAAWRRLNSSSFFPLFFFEIKKYVSADALGCVSHYGQHRILTHYPIKYVNT